MFDYVFRVLAALHERRHGKPAIIFVLFVVPVSSSKPTLATHQKNPNFCPSDTTFLAERTIESIKLNGMKPEKLFVTDTGVQIPAVTLATRNTILNSAHNYGLSHDRFVTLSIWALKYDILLTLLFLGNDEYLLWKSFIVTHVVVLISEWLK
jgi:hypothetical protein